MRQPELFSCVMPTGISYCDKSREVAGDYVKVAHLFFDDLSLAIFQPRSKLLPEIKADAARLQARKGEAYRVSACGQTVTLGSALLKQPGFQPPHHTPGPWVYEEETRTIRSYPQNYWLATMDSFDGAVNNPANARRIIQCVNACEGVADPSAVSDMLAALEAIDRADTYTHERADAIRKCRAAIAKATGQQ